MLVCFRSYIYFIVYMLIISLLGSQPNRKRSASELSNASTASDPSAPSSRNSSVLPQSVSSAASRSIFPSSSPYYPGTSALVYSLSGRRSVFYPHFVSSNVVEASDVMGDEGEEEETNILPNANSETRRNRRK